MLIDLRHRSAGFFLPPAGSVSYRRRVISVVVHTRPVGCRGQIQKHRSDMGLRDFRVCTSWRLCLSVVRGGLSVAVLLEGKTTDRIPLHMTAPARISPACS
jgi:hypothetical protein